MRTENQVPHGDATIINIKWMPERIRPVSGVVVLFSSQENAAVDAFAANLTEDGYVVCQFMLPESNDPAVLTAQYDHLKNQYLAVPFYAVAEREAASVATRLANAHPDAFDAMVWSYPAATAVQRRGSTWFDMLDWRKREELLPPVPLFILTDALPVEWQTALERPVDHPVTVTLLPKTDPDAAWEALRWQLALWRGMRIEDLIQTKRGALQWDREANEEE